MVDPPTGEAEVATAKAALLKGTAYESAERFVFVSARHTFEETWRAKILLERFAESEGNTLGIRHVGFGNNIRYNDEDVFLHGYQVRGKLDDGRIDQTTVRGFVILWAPDAQRVADAVPQLASQLGIPATTVGMVRDTHLAGETFGQVGGGSGSAGASAEADVEPVRTDDDGTDSVTGYAAPVVQSGGDGSAAEDVSGSTRDHVTEAAGDNRPWVIAGLSTAVLLAVTGVAFVVRAVRRRT